MTVDDVLGAQALRARNLAILDDVARAAIRASDDLDGLLALRAQLRTIEAGRGRWLLWTWLLLLSGVTVAQGGSVGIIGLAIVLAIVVAIINHVARVRRMADRATAWLSEIDFRLAQLAARGEP